MSSGSDNVIAAETVTFLFMFVAPFGDLEGSWP